MTEKKNFNKGSGKGVGGKTTKNTYWLTLFSTRNKNKRFSFKKEPTIYVLKGEEWFQSELPFDFHTVAEHYFHYSSQIKGFS